MNVIERLKEEIDELKMLTGENVSTRFYHIFKTDQPLQAKAVLFPTSTEEVSEILKICNEFDQPVVVHGGLTNLVGSTETSSEEVVISMEKMNQIEEVDTQSRTITLQAGVILENAQEIALKENLLLPLNYGARGSAQMGGAIATNAGGLRVLKYGMTRNLILGLEVVLANGTVINSMKKIIKDNSAYDIKQLFIGSEGTLGVVTRAVIKLVEKPISRNAAMVAVEEYNHVVEFLKLSDAHLSGKLSGYELIWNAMYQTMTAEKTGLKPPLPSTYKYYILLESHGSDLTKDAQEMELLLEKALEKGLIQDGVLAQSTSDVEWFFSIRENVDIMVNECTHDQHFDISMPIPLIGKIADEIKVELKQIEGVENVYTFGHIADGNIHFIVGKVNESESLKNNINDVVYAPLKAIGGSVSAEHGIGVHKKAYLHLCRIPEEIALMKTLKNSLDPKGILNRGKVLD